MTISIDIPERKTMIPKITVLGVGGAGGNAVNNMINSELKGVNFVVANTDAQALVHSKAGTKIQLGENLTKGLGAGSAPEIGAQAAEESHEEIMSQLGDSNMVFITAGMGGGTGTGAAPEIARVCKENGILTVGVITKPFHFEGSFRMKAADIGTAEMQKNVDTLICIPNQNLFHKATEKTTFAEAFNMVDDILYSGIKGITDLMTMPGLINLDFADIRAIMGGMGKAMMGTGESGGDKRALEAAEAAISNPLLDNASMKGAKGVLINISGGLDMTLFEADEAAQRIKDEVDPDANIIFGSTFDKELDGQIRVSVVATGIDLHANNISDRASLFQRLENTFPVNKAPANKVFQPSRPAQTFSRNEPVAQPAVAASVKASNAEEAQVDVEKAFIPPQIVDPASLQRSDAAIEQEAFAANPFQPVAQVAQPASEVVAVTTPLEGQAGGNEVSSPYAGEQVISEAKVIAETPSQEEIKPKSKPFGSILNFFKDSTEEGEDPAVVEVASPIEEQKVANDDQEDESGDLIFSDDILNVPTFLRNKGEKSS